MCPLLLAPFIQCRKTSSALTKHIHQKLNLKIRLNSSKKKIVFQNKLNYSTFQKISHCDGKDIRKLITGNKIPE